jgi:hypothetical protein
MVTQTFHLTPAKISSPRHISVESEGGRGGERIGNYLGEGGEQEDPVGERLGPRQLDDAGDLLDGLQQHLLLRRGGRRGGSENRGGHAPAYEANRRRRDGCAELVRRRRDRAGEARSGDTVAAAALEAMAGIGGGLVAVGGGRRGWFGCGRWRGRGRGRNREVTPLRCCCHHHPPTPELFFIITLLISPKCHGLLSHSIILF